MRIFKTKWVARYARRAWIVDDSLRDAIERADRGLVDADLGGGLIKQRVARVGQGRSGGYRTLIAYRAGARAVFLYVFAKSDRENVSPDELLAWREIGSIWLLEDEQGVRRAIKEEELEEITDVPDREAQPYGPSDHRDG